MKMVKEQMKWYENHQVFRNINFQKILIEDFQHEQECKMKKAKIHKVSKLFITIKWIDDPFR